MTYASCQKKISSKNNCDIQTMVEGHKTGEDQASQQTRE